MRDRFGIQHRLDHYDPPELARIVRRSARLLGVQIEDGGALAIAARSRGTPRVANRLLKRVRDFAEVRRAGVVSAEIAAAALDLLEVDTMSGSIGSTREILRIDLREVQRRPGQWPLGRSPPRSVRSRTQSRTPTSLTCCSAWSDRAHAARARRDEARLLSILGSSRRLRSFGLL